MKSYVRQVDNSLVEGEYSRLVRPHSEAEFAALKASIAERGVQVPVVCDELGNLLDGFHRVRACQELAIKDWPSKIERGLSEDEKQALVVSLNMDSDRLPWERQRGEKEPRPAAWYTSRVTTLPDR